MLMLPPDLTKTMFEIYGLGSGSASANLYSASCELVTIDEIVRTWTFMCLESEGITSLPTYTQTQMSILARKSRVYSLARARFDCEHIPSDQSIFYVAAFAIVEVRMGHSHISECHRRALGNLLFRRGGVHALERITYVVRLMVVGIMIELEFPELLRASTDLALRVLRVQEKLRQIQLWNQELRRIRAAEGPDPAMSPPHHLRLLQNRLIALSTPSVSEYIRFPLHDLSTFQQRCYLAVLFTINVTLLAFSNSPETTDAYLQSFVHSAQMGMSQDSSNRLMRALQIKLPSWQVLVTIGQNAAGSVQHRGMEDDLPSPEAVFEFVEITMMSSLASRYATLQALLSWLVSADEAGLSILAPEAFDDMAEEVEAACVGDKNR